MPLGFYQLSCGKCFLAVGAAPIAGIGFEAQIKQAAVHRFQNHIIVPENIKPENIEVETSPVKRVVCCPVIRDTLVLNKVSGLKTLDAIGTAADRNLLGALAKIPIPPPVAGEDGQLPEYQR